MPPVIGLTPLCLGVHSECHPKLQSYVTINFARTIQESLKVKVLLVDLCPQAYVEELMRESLDKSPGDLKTVNLKNLTEEFYDKTLLKHLQNPFNLDDHGVKILRKIPVVILKLIETVQPRVLILNLKPGFCPSQLIMFPLIQHLVHVTETVPPQLSCSSREREGYLYNLIRVQNCEILKLINDHSITCDQTLLDNFKFQTVPLTSILLTINVCSWSTELSPNTASEVHVYFDVLGLHNLDACEEIFTVLKSLI